MIKTLTVLGKVFLISPGTCKNFKETEDFNFNPTSSKYNWRRINAISFSDAAERMDSVEHLFGRPEIKNL